MLNVNLEISLALCLSKTTNSRYKYLGHFLMPPIPHYWNISIIMLSLKCEQRSSKLHVLLSTLKPKLRHSFSLSKLRISPSKVKLKLGHNFSQFIHRFKIVIFWVIVLCFISESFRGHKDILGFLNVSLSGFLNLTNSWRIWKIEYKSMLHFQFFPNLIKS